MANLEAMRQEQETNDYLAVSKAKQHIQEGLGKITRLQTILDYVHEMRPLACGGALKESVDSVIKWAHMQRQAEIKALAQNAEIVANADAKLIGG